MDIPSSPSILIIDDSKDLSLSISLIFEMEGYQPTIADSGQSVKRLLAQTEPNYHYDLVLLDLHLPDVHGRDLYPLLREAPATSQSSIIVFSGEADLRMRVELMAMGADDYLVKPCSFDEILARSTIQLQLSRLRQEKQDAEAQIARQVHYLQAINQIGNKAAQYLDLEAMLNEVTKAIITSFGCAGCSIYLYDPNMDDDLQLLIQVTNGTSTMPLAADVTSSLQLTPSIHENVVSVPIIRDDTILGMCLIDCDPAQVAGLIPVFTVLMTQLATAVTNAYLFQDIQQHNSDLEKLNRQNASLLEAEQTQRQQAEQLHYMGQLISASLNEEDVFSSAIDSLRAMFNVMSGSIILRDPQTGDLLFASSMDELSALQHTRIPAGKGIVGQVVATGYPLIVNDVQQYPHFFAVPDSKTGMTTQSTLCVPLNVQDRIIGAIQLINKKNGRFSETDLNLLSGIASSIAIAIDNAQLYRQQATLIQQLHASQDQLVQSEKLAATGRLAASLAHEINNPLQAVHSCLQLTIEFDLPPKKQIEYLQMATEEVERLSALVNHIMDFSRPSTKKPTAESINKLINQVMRLADKHISHHNWTIEQHLASDIPPIPVVADQIAQVFLSIVLNAFDAMSDDDMLQIDTQYKDGWILARFRDNGKGMTADVMENIFEPFYTTKDMAAGLSLTISYNIIRQHGGYIDVESEPGQGSLFTVRLPGPQK